jgi:vacuolar protein sorting-associated protein 51
VPAYISTLLSSSDLETVLRTESTLVSEIRGLDGERKALVYDNYSKLIAATDTIRRMRSSMDPLTPTTSTLAPAVAHIAETAAGVARGLVERVGEGHGAGGEGQGREERRVKERETVRWVLGAPARLGRLVEDGRGDEARAEWAEVKELLGFWQGVKGVMEVREACEKALEGLGDG